MNEFYEEIKRVGEKYKMVNHFQAEFHADTSNGKLRPNRLRQNLMNNLLHRHLQHRNPSIPSSEPPNRRRNSSNETNVKRGVQGHGGGEFRATEDPIARRVPCLGNAGRRCEGSSRKPAEDVVKNVVVHRRNSGCSGGRHS